MIRRLKNGVQAVLRRTGFTLVATDRFVLPPDWTRIAGDRLACRHVPGYVGDAGFEAALEQVVQAQAFSEVPTWRLHVLWKAVQACSGIEGAIVEFGSFRGGCARVMRDADKSRSRAVKELYLYDTFSGIPDDGLTPAERDSGFAGRFSDTSVERVLRLVDDERVNIRAGKLPATLAEDPPEKVAFAHIDLNAAAVTGEVLEWLLPRWQSGGCWVFDDYLWAGYEDQRQVVDEFAGRHGLTVLSFPTGQGLVFKI